MIERDFKEAYIKMKERALEAEQALTDAKIALKKIDILVHTPSYGRDALGNSK